MFTDFRKWSKTDIRRLIDYITEIAKSGHEQNRIMYCYNSVLTICLGCEFLKDIGKNVSVYTQEAYYAVNKILTLGGKLIGSIGNKHIEATYLERDFKDRTVINIIILNDFAPLMYNTKVDILLQQIWVGKKTYECDGDFSDFSMLTFLKNAQIQKLPGKMIRISELLGSKFKLSIHE